MVACTTLCISWQVWQYHCLSDVHQQVHQIVRLPLGNSYVLYARLPPIKVLRLSFAWRGHRWDKPIWKQALKLAARCKIFLQFSKAAPLKFSNCCQSLRGACMDYLKLSIYGYIKWFYVFISKVKFIIHDNLNFLTWSISISTTNFYLRFLQGNDTVPYL